MAVSAPPTRGAGVGEIMAIAACSGLPVSLCSASAAPRETTFVGALVASRLAEGKPSRLMGDKACDSDPLDAACRESGVELITPPRRHRSKPRPQDGHAWRRYKRCDCGALSPGEQAGCLGSSSPERVSPSLDGRGGLSSGTASSHWALGLVRCAAAKASPTPCILSVPRTVF